MADLTREISSRVPPSALVDHVAGAHTRVVVDPLAMVDAEIVSYEPGVEPSGHVTFAGRDTYLDGTILNAGSAAEGLVMNNRMVQAVADFSGNITFDPSANVGAFIDQLPVYRSYGINALTVNFQGGLPQPIGSITWGASESTYNNSAFNSNGTIKAAFASRILAATEAMLAVGIIPIWGLFYFRQDGILTNEAAVLAAVDNACALLADYQGKVIIETANEINSGSYNHGILSVARAHELVARVQARGHYATVSFAGGYLPPTSVGGADVILLHGNDRTTSQIVSDINAAKSRFPNHPIFYNEDGPTNRTYASGELMAHFDAAVAGGVGWGYYMQSEYQNAVSPRINWAVDRASTIEFHNRVAHHTDSEGTLPTDPEGAWLEAGGRVVVEVESEPAAGLWSSTTAAGGYSGTALYRWIGPNRFSSPGTDSTLRYDFKITDPGTYRIYFRSWRFGSGASDEHNDMWLKVDSGPWEKYWQRGNTHGVWEWRHRIEREIGGITEPNNEPDFFFDAGYHSIEVTGRSTDFAIDRLHVYKPNTETANPALSTPVSEREGETDPGDPPIDVSEPYPANPDVILAAGASIQPHIGTAGRIVEIAAGANYGDQQLSPATGVYLFARSGDAVFPSTLTVNPNYDPAIIQNSGSVGSKRWIENGGNGVTLRGISARRYGPVASQNDSAFLFPSGSNGWKLIDVDIQQSLNACVVWRGSGHELRRCILHDAGRYGWSNGTNSLIKDCVVYRIGPDYYGTVTSNDRGITKMAGGSSGMFVDGLRAFDIDGKGVWWDGARDGRGRRLRISNITHIAVDVEVCWGGALNPPPNKTVVGPDYAFVLEDMEVIGQTQQDQLNPFWPTPSAYGVSITPGVLMRDFYGKDVTTGISSIFTSSHGTFTDGYPAQNISAQWAQDNLFMDRIRFENFELEGFARRYVAGVTGGWSSGATPPRFVNGTYNMTAIGSLGPFRWLSNNNMSLSQFLALAQP